MKKGKALYYAAGIAASAMFVYPMPVQAAGGIEVQASDVLSVLSNCKPYLLALGIILIAAIAFSIYCRKFQAPKRKMLRGQALVAAIAGITIVLNMLCTGPLSTLLDVVANPAQQVNDGTMQEASELITELGEEGIVLVKNTGILPLSEETKNLNVFGWASTNPCYGGTGSGSVDTTKCITLLSGLEAGGYTLNQDLIDFYTSYATARGEATMSSVDWTLPEPTADSYTEDLLNGAKEFSDTAVIVISRVGGEGSDLPTDFGKKNEDGTPYYTYTNNSSAYEDFSEGQHYLELSQTEKNMVQLVCDNFDKVIVICNSANAMELGWVNEYPQIGGVLCCPGAGDAGFKALGEILSGQVNPSGKLADTYVYDLTAAPAYANFGEFSYDNMEEYGWVEQNPFTGEESVNDVNFVNYTENIYVGYKFYETAFEEAKNGNMQFDYDKTVQYPFGYGLSYTEFSQTMTSFVPSADSVDITVTVTNTGNTAGKDVVEVYYNPPYTNGGIEKAAANLLTFGKTGELQPGESQELSFHIDQEQMASFDAHGKGCYVLEGGEYKISIRSDAHNVIEENIFTVASDVVYDGSNARTSDQEAAVSRFEYAEGDGVVYLSRRDGFSNYAEAVAAPVSFSMSEERKSKYTNASNYDIEGLNQASDEMPLTGQSSSVVLADLRGKEYDDPQWEELLNKMSIEDMSGLIAGGGYQTAAVSSIKKKATTDNDGPATIYNNYTGARGNAYPTEVMIANTWNKELSQKMGESIGKEADEMDVSGWYAPAMNIHRTAFGGRNFEYYSEDAVLSGEMAAAAIKGANEYGVYSYIKHFALNDQETNRIYQICTWCTEQALRENYLKAFEIAVKEGSAGAVMDAHSFIGDRWCGATGELNNEVLRGEWGFKGFVSTDMFAGYGYYDADIAIRNGVDSMLNPMNAPDAAVTDTTSASSVKAMRTACHNILYTVVNSRAYKDGSGYRMVLWKKIMIGCDVAVVLLLALIEAAILRRYKKAA